MKEIVMKRVIKKKMVKKIIIVKINPTVIEHYYYFRESLYKRRQNNGSTVSSENAEFVLERYKIYVVKSKKKNNIYKLFSEIGIEI